MHVWPFMYVCIFIYIYTYTLDKYTYGVFST